jgi:hypothetical protein
MYDLILTETGTGAPRDRHITRLLIQVFFSQHKMRKEATLYCSPEKYLSHMARDGKLIMAYIELCCMFTQGGTEPADASCRHTIIGNVSRLCATFYKNTVF